MHASPRFRLLLPVLVCALAPAALGQSFLDNIGDIPSGNPANNSASENVDFADVDLDGDWDAAFADGGDGGNDQNRLWINLGPGPGLGVFADQTSTRFPSVSDTSRDIEFVDFDGDGDADVYVSNTSAVANQTNRWWRNTGVGDGVFVDETAARWVNLGVNDGFTTFSSVPVSAVLGSGGFIDWSCDCDFADLDNDGDLDLVHSSYGGAFGGQVPTRLFLNDGAGFFEEFNPSGFQLSGTTISNGSPALWAEGVHQSNTTDSSGAEADIANTPLDVDLGDLDGDFDVDILHGARNEVPRLFYNRLEEAGGTLVAFRDVTYGRLSQTATGGGNYEQELGDVDGDGDLDIYGLNWSGFTDVIAKNDGSGSFGPFASLPFSGADDNEADFLDYDQDGDLDVFVANFSGQDRLYRNDGTGSFAHVTGSELPASNGTALDADCADVDNDGDTDVFVSNDNGQANVYLENITQVPDTTAPSLPRLEQAPDRDPGPDPTVVRVHVYDNAPYYVTWYNPTRLEVAVDGGAPTVYPMVSSGGQIFRGEIPGTLEGTVCYQAFSVDPYGNEGASVVRCFEAGSTPPPVAEFSATPTAGDAPLFVAFTDLSTGPVTSWSWDFGDGNTSTLQNPSNTYTAAGTYTVTLTATGPGGSDGETKVAYVTVTDPAPVAEFSGTPTSGTYPLAVSFTDLSTGPVTSWSWDFGDGNTSTLQNPSNTYTAAGTYTVTLTATGPGGSDGETKVAYVTVTDPAPVAEFSGTPTSGTYPLAVSFTDLSTGPVTSWSWDFGDGNTSTLQNPSNIYTSAGTYTVTLTATGPGGSDGETKVAYVTVTDPAPVAEFSGTPTSGTYPLAVSFTDLSTGPVTSWSWDFGDGNTSTLQNPSNTYTAAGTYTVTLTATGPGGSDGETKVAYVTVTDPAPVAEFSGTPTSGVAPLAVGFTDLSTGPVTSWSWDFGDGNTSTLQNPSNTYTAAGSYTVTLTATGPGGSDGETKVAYVTVTDPAPVAEFSGTPTSGTYPLAVSFTDLSTGPVTSWSWDFGDGNTSTLQNPSNTYTAAGTYTVTLTATGPGGSDGETKVAYVTVTDPAPVAEFSGTPTSGTYPLAVSFTDLSTGPVTSWSWDFGDGNTSTLQNPSNTYTAAGTYTVTLTATGPGGSDGETKVAYVTVTDPAPVAEFSGTPTSGVAPLAVSFTDLSTGPVTSWSWDFGDGNTSTLQNPSNTYTAAGTYTVTLTATGPGGSDGETKVAYVTVTDPAPVAEFSGTPTSGTYPLAVSFTDLSTGPVTSWSWDFGDGNTSTLQDPSNTYTAAGTYTVTLTATGPGGSDGETKVAYVTVTDPAPVAEFSGTPTSGVAPLAVSFTDLSTGPVTSWSWDFGDGNTSTLQNPSNTYTAAGSYTVTLTATGPGGADGETKTGYVTVAPFEIYCTAKVNSQGCVPQITASGTPGVSDPNPFDIGATMVLNQRNGLLFYGLSGRATIPFFGGTLCVQPALRRLPIQNAGGTLPPTNDCSGSYAFDFNAHIQSGIDVLLVPGQQVNAQYWSRDPNHPDGTGVGLTDAVEFTVGS